MTNAVRIIEHLAVPEHQAKVMGRWATQAEQSIRCLIGDEKYDALELVTSDDTAALQKEKSLAQRAESLYAFYHAAPFVNLTPGDCGGFVRATGFDSSRVEVMSKRELDSYRAEALRQASELLAGMMQTSALIGII